MHSSRRSDYLVQSHGLVQTLALVPPAAVPLVPRIVQQHVQSLLLTQSTLQHSRGSPQEILRSVCFTDTRQAGGVTVSFVHDTSRLAWCG